MTTVANRWPYRMKDLCAQSGLSRQAIHNYMQQGLLPEGNKRGRNMAWYGQEHLERLALIRRLQSERLLPLKTIKALLEDHPTEDVDPEQREMLVDLKSRLSGDLAASADARETVDVRTIIAGLDVDLAEVRRMAELDLITLVEDDGIPRIPRASVWMLELWGQIRQIGLTDEIGFTVDDMLIYEQVVSSLFKQERELFTTRLVNRSGAEVAEMLTRALPLIHTFIAHYHTAALREYFAALD